MTALLVFGGDSLVGSDFCHATDHELTAVGRHDPRDTGLPFTAFCEADLADARRIEEVIRTSPAEIMLNFAAYTDVDRAERERPGSEGLARGTAFEINARAPETLARAARDSGKYLLSISTDFVFDGRNGPYGENELPAPLSRDVSWYGWTKGEGERRIRASGARAAIVRIAYPYRASFPRKLDFARKIVDASRRHLPVAYFADQTITPTWIPDLRVALEFLIRERPTGTFHVASPEVTTPFDFARELLSELSSSGESVTKGSMEEFLRREGTTPRPRHGGLTCRRILTEGVPLTSWHQGIRRFVSEGGGR